MGKILKFFFPILLAISILLLIYTFYKSEIYWEGLKREYYFVYYIISISISIFSIFTFFISNRFKEYLIIVSLSIIFSLYSFEGFLILKKNNLKKKFFNQQLEKEFLYTQTTGKKWDRRSKFQIYNDLKKKDETIAVTINPSSNITGSSEFFPLSGISNVKTIHCNENGYYATYISDRYGFNNPDNQWDSDTIDFFLIGDSTTHGACVDRPYDIGSVLRELSQKSVLNLGYNGNGPLIQYATLREYLIPNVKRVIWIYYEGNDLIDLNGEKNNKILAKYLNDSNFSQNLMLIQNSIDNFLKKKINKEAEVKRENLKFNTFKFIKLFNLRKLILENKKFASTLELKIILQKAKKLIDKNNSKFYFVYIPEYNRYKLSYDNRSYNSIKKIVKELGVEFIDIIEEVYEKEQNPLKLYPFDFAGHHNINGYKKISDAIYELSR